MSAPIDQHVEDLLESLEEYVDTQQKLDEIVATGFLDLANANKSLTSNARYDTTMYDVREHVAVTQLQANSADVEKETTNALQLSPNQPKLCLRPFGAFSPLSLKQAQKGFYTALQEMVQLANLKARILALECDIEKEKTKEKKTSARDEKIEPTSQNLESSTDSDHVSLSHAHSSSMQEIPQTS